MATPAALYFAGIGTVVGAISLGFAGAMVLTSTQPVQKAPPSGFAKREQPIEVQVVAPAQTVGTTGQAPARTASFEIVPATPTKVEEVVGLKFAPPQPQTNDAPAPRTIAPDPTPTRAATPAVQPPVEPAVKPPSDKPASDAVKSERKLKKHPKPTAVAEKKESARKQYVERRKKQVDMDNDDDEPIRATAFASERPSRSGEGFFSFLFGN